MFLGDQDQIIQFLLEDGTIKGAILDATNIVKSAISAHNLFPTEALILGQALCASALITTTIKGEDRLNISIECGGPIGGLSCDLNAQGDVRGYLLNNPIAIDQNKTVSIDNLYGPGFLHVRRLSSGSKTPFTGSVELCYPDFASNLAYYYTTSEQTPTAFVLSLYFDEDKKFEGASGLMLQALPGAVDNKLEELQNYLVTLSKNGECLFSQIKRHGDAGSWLTKNLGNYNLNVIGLKSVRYACGCSKQMLVPFIQGFTKDKLSSLTTESGAIEVKCHGCSTVYSFSKEEINFYLGDGDADK